MWHLLSEEQEAEGEELYLDLLFRGLLDYKRKKGDTLVIIVLGAKGARVHGEYRRLP